VDEFCRKYNFLARKYRIVMILFSWGEYSVIRGGESPRKFCSDRQKNVNIPEDQWTFYRAFDYTFVEMLNGRSAFHIHTFGWSSCSGTCSYGTLRTVGLS
jgi:hypothetical protein